MFLIVFDHANACMMQGTLNSRKISHERKPEIPCSIQTLDEIERENIAAVSVLPLPARSIKSL